MPPLVIERRGKGKQLLVLGGGPGLAHDYLTPALRPLEAGRELIYLDYPGCGRSQFDNANLTAEGIAQAALEAIQTAGVETPADVLCHSFGSYVLAAILRRCSAVKIRRCILVCPSPHSRALCRRAEERLINRMSEADRHFVAAVLAEGAAFNRELMRRLLPYYFGRGDDLPNIEIDFYPRAYLGLVGSLDEFDLNTTIATIESKLYIFGTADFITPDLFPFEETHSVVLNGGHFVFYERNEQFVELVTAFLSSC